MTSAQELVRYEVAGRVAYVTLNRPRARNALTFEMYDRVEALCDEVDGDAEVRVMVLRGSGGHFAAGTDISQFQAFNTAEQAIAYERQQDRVMDRIEAVNKPTIAAIEGVAAGGGAMMAVSCDLRIMAAGASIGIPVARTLGNCLSIRNAQRLSSLIGTARTKQLIFGAMLLPAEDAFRWGLASEVVDGDDFGQHVRQTAERLALHAPITLRVTKEEARRIAAHGRVPAELADDLIAEAYLSADFREGVAAFLAKRPPTWQGR